METIEKVNVKQLKEDIRVLAAEQKELRNQRKTVRFSGTRTMEPWEATMNHFHNRQKLRVMYAAYAILRGRELSEIDSGKFETEYDKSHFETSLEEILKKYRS